MKEDRLELMEIYLNIIRKPDEIIKCIQFKIIDAHYFDIIFRNLDV